LTAAAPSGFSFGNAMRFDGVNDFLTTTDGAGTPENSSDIFNPFNNTDWTIAFWAKAESGERFKNNGVVMGVAQAVGSGTRSMFSFQNDGTGSRMKVQTNSRNVPSTGHTIAIGDCDDWHHYAATVTQNGANQDVVFYIDGVSVDSISTTVNTVTDTTVSACIGAERTSGSNTYKGYLDEIVLAEAAASAADILNLYNAGAGATPVGLISDLINYYKVSDAAGTTTGDITDTNSVKDIELLNFLTPYGVTSETP